VSYYSPLIVLSDDIPVVGSKSHRRRPAALANPPPSSFFDYADPTHGMITYVSAAEAYSSGLAYVQGDGVAIMTVDTNSTLSSGVYRKSYVKAISLSISPIPLQGAHHDKKVVQ
jgi:hypothetical protein